MYIIKMVMKVEKENLIKEINLSIKKIEDMIENNIDSAEIRAEKVKLDKLLEDFDKMLN